MLKTEIQKYWIHLQFIKKYIILTKSNTEKTHHKHPSSACLHFFKVRECVLCELFLEGVSSSSHSLIQRSYLSLPLF